MFLKMNNPIQVRLVNHHFKFLQLLFLFVSVVILNRAINEVVVTPVWIARS